MCLRVPDGVGEAVRTRSARNPPAGEEGDEVGLPELVHRVAAGDALLPGQVGTGGHLEPGRTGSIADGQLSEYAPPLLEASVDGVETGQTADVAGCRII